MRVDKFLAAGTAFSDWLRTNLNIEFPPSNVLIKYSLNSVSAIEAKRAY